MNPGSSCLTPPELKDDRTVPGLGDKGHKCHLDTLYVPIVPHAYVYFGPYHILQSL